MVEGVARLLPGALGNPESAGAESFRDGLLEEPLYTRPAEFRGWAVPEVLLSGDHARIAAWRRRPAAGAHPASAVPTCCLPVSQRARAGARLPPPDGAPPSRLWREGIPR